MSAYICLDLTPYVNNRGMTAITDYEKGTLSEGKSSFPMELLPTNKPFLIHDIPFAWSKTEEHDNIELTGQTLSFEATEVKEIYILGVSSNGDYFDQISFLHDGQEVCREYLYLSDFAATTASFRDRQALVTDYLHTRTGKYELVQPRMWLEQIPFASPCLINQIRLEDNPAMHIFAITLAGQKRGGH